MSEHKHTPGPWNVYHLDRGGWWYVETLGPDAPADVATAFHNEANARLIAAAPEMLKALKVVIAATYDDFPEALQMSLAAIAKAEGRL